MSNKVCVSLFYLMDNSVKSTCACVTKRCRMRIHHWPYTLPFYNLQGVSKPGSLLDTHSPSHLIADVIGSSLGPRIPDQPLKKEKKKKEKEEAKLIVASSLIRLPCFHLHGHNNTYLPVLELSSTLRAFQILPQCNVLDLLKAAESGRFFYNFPSFSSTEAVYTFFNILTFP